MAEEFIEAINQYIDYWSKQTDRTEKEKMEGLAFSILCILDGTSGSFSGDINSLAKECDHLMLHDQFYKNESVTK